MRTLVLALLIPICCLIPTFDTPANPAEKLRQLTQRVNAYTPDPAYKDDTYGLLVVQTALAAIHAGSGGIGACLVDPATGKITDTGQNRQYDGYFRSDLHAEMDLLNRYENRMRKKRTPRKGSNPRECGNLILVTSMEPCPMCLTRIINSGIKTVLYVESDPRGGMARRLSCLPPFWQEFAADREFRRADCSPALRKLANDLFHFSKRDFAKSRKR